MNFIFDGKRFRVTLFSNAGRDPECHFSIVNDRCSTAGHGMA